MIIVYTLLATLGGISFSIQGPINAGLGKKTNRYQATLISFIGGFLTTGLLVILLGNGDLSLIKTVEPWKLFGGLLGIFNVCVSVSCMPIIGVTLALTVNMVGQLFMAFIIDSFGLFEVSQKPVSMFRILGILVAAFGIYLIYIGNKDKKESNSYNKTKLIAIAFMFISGVSGAVQAPTNRALSNVIGRFEGTFMNFVVGLISIFIVTMIINKGKFEPMHKNNVKFFNLLGGLFGSIGVFLNLLTVGVVGSTIQTIAQLIGQLSGGLIIDATGALETKKIKVNKWRIIGVLTIILGVLIILYAA